ncbi:DUF1292 domain-containing protein [Salipaludibacillus agaradhaerens]|jgi:uncharacterized protein YrzB (UPF0473 family)|uniref:UPF0473 protein HXA33_10300 n=1 Tax=Salipaludibacillus agaradhaerens TaxID=76935 RepID=A0A9Q4FZM5_SALAG|nr:DUF1292 domain-containing protein [Salipaludibacillus agaradhaerens]UJW57368.1 DUF1292 domain-containing protein [Bacillus sp. A116_S68]MCR6096948.1 DUF1292 domain-containing protein [Salipaludibacillus agaradhaerens]MCR6106224.1 DUF1292 domain-containing protein [Salipaludibacillus agaradhaerens]MCR6113567.1 DUF1292 domain-containing protein [Salipaludibacillus agaradhaerens]MCR6118257.1 DUF1292 domain-containing protein [Salipaludibacillus agaradhaerens]
MVEYRMNEASDDDRIVIPDENGDEHLFQVLFTFDVDSTGNSYMVLAPEGSNESEEDEVEVHAFRYEEPEGGELSLYAIETDEEWNMVEELLNTFADGELEEEN